MVVYTNLANTYAALGDSTRLQILAHLKDGPKSCSDLVGKFDLTQQAVSKHIGVLNKAGLLSQTKQGRSRICELVSNSLEEAYKWIEERGTAEELPQEPLIGFGSVAIIRHGRKVRAYHSTSNYQTTTYQ